MARLDPPSELAHAAERASATVREAAEVAVGLGILGVNRVQALRREAAARLADVGRGVPEPARVDDEA